jgi:hypothetical protein
VLNREQYKVLKKFIKQVKTNYPDREIIFSNWTTDSANLSKKEIEILLTISHSPVVSSINKFGFNSKNTIYIDNHTYDQLNEYRENHNWWKKTLEIVGLISILVTTIFGLIKLFEILI